MELVNKIITKRNLWVLEVITGIVTLLIVYSLYQYTRDIDFSKLDLMSLSFYVALLCTILATAGAGFLLFYKKSKDKQVLIIFIIGLIYTVGCLFLLPFITAMNDVMHPSSLESMYGGFQSSYQLNNSSSSEGKMLFFILAGAVQIIFSIYSAIRVALYRKANETTN